MRIAIRVDASAKIGTGHLRRMLALAVALREVGGDVRFVTRMLGIDSVGMIAGSGFENTMLLAPPGNVFTPDPDVPHSGWAQVPFELDVGETVDALSEFVPDWVVLDSYAFDAKWHDGVRGGLDCRIAAIDDLADRQMTCDLLIDHTYAPNHRVKYAQVLPRSARLLGGPRFGLLGPAYAEAPRYEFNDSVRSIGIFMGGVDPDGFSGRVLDAIAASGFSGGVEIVSTSANPNLAALEARVEGYEGASLSLDLPELAEFFARHDLQIGAGGGASWERCCIGVPTLLVVIAPNQMSVAPMLAAEGVADYAPDPVPDKLSAKIKALIGDAPGRRAYAEASRKLVDGLGAQRAALTMLSPSLSVRLARMDDAQRLFYWRNAEENRVRMNEQGEFGWEDHVDWLKRVLADKKRLLMIGEVGGTPVGVIRFDNLDEEWPEVSLHLDPEMSGLGLGPYLLHAGEKAADPPRVLATVLEDNAPSQALFARGGYEQISARRWVKRRNDAKAGS